jgi:hypothetical protein
MPSALRRLHGDPAGAEDVDDALASDPRVRPDLRELIIATRTLSDSLADLAREEQ